MHSADSQKMIRLIADPLRAINPNFTLHYQLVMVLGFQSPDNHGQPNGDWIQIMNGESLL